MYYYYHYFSFLFRSIDNIYFDNTKKPFFSYQEENLYDFVAQGKRNFASSEEGAPTGCRAITP